MCYIQLQGNYNLGKSSSAFLLSAIPEQNYQLASSSQNRNYIIANEKNHLKTCTFNQVDVELF